MYEHPKRAKKTKNLCSRNIDFFFLLFLLNVRDERQGSGLQSYRGIMLTMFRDSVDQLSNEILISLYGSYYMMVLH